MFQTTNQFMVDRCKSIARSATDFTSPASVTSLASSGGSQLRFPPISKASLGRFFFPREATGVSDAEFGIQRESTEIND